jgi:hypothetical protein
MGSFFTSQLVSRKIVAMRIAYAVLGLLAACGDDTNMFPVGGGGTDGGFGGDGNRPIDARLADAKVTDANVLPVDANVFQGRVCLLVDARQLHNCATTGAGNLTVRLGTATALTQADGTFFIAGQSEANLVWRVTGANIKSSYEVLRDYQIPAMTTTMFDALKTANTVQEVAGEGSLFIEVTRDATGISGALAASTPPAFYLPFYDGASATVWNRGSTGANGAVWIPGQDVGTATVTVTAGAASQQLSMPVFDDGITFANAIFP